VAEITRRDPGTRLECRPGVTGTRIVVRGATTAVTRRTTFRKAFLAPWHPLVEQCWLYALADAQRVLGFAVHHAVRVITHHHLSVTPSAPINGEILRRFHHDVSCAINTLLAHERYDEPRNVFDGREPHCMRLLDAAAQASHLTYEFLNPVAAGLVARPEHMPGTVMDWGHWKSGGIVVRRPDVYFGRERPDEIRLKLTPPPLLMQAFDGDLDALVHHMRRLSDEGIRALRESRRREPVGAQKLRRMHPWMEPKTLAEPGGRLLPTFKVGARGLAGRRVRGEAASEVRAWRREHEYCRQLRLAGEHAVFPHGTYAMRVFHRVPVADPLPDAIVAQPGPLLDEVLEEQRQRKSEASNANEPGVRAQLLDEVRAVWRDEAAQVAELDTLDFVDGRYAEVSEQAEPPSDRLARPEPRVRHRFDRELERRAPHPRRIITKRDRRRGRPPGAAPPE
jgi:hypothetical protein